MQDQFKLNRQLEQKFHKQADFHQEMQEKKLIFQENKAQLAYQPDINIDEQLLSIFALEKNYQVYFYYAYMQPQEKSKTPNIALYLIKQFNPKFHKKYKFVFFNNNVQNKQIYYEFKKIFLTFPLDYYLALDEFIFIKPMFSQKVSQWWASDQLEKYLKAKTRYINQTSELCPLLNTTLQKLIQFLPRQIVTNQFPQEAGKLNLKQKKLADYRMNLTGQQRNKKQQQIFQNFMLSVNNFFQSSNNQPIQIDQYECNQAKLPLILEELFLYFDQNPQSIKVEGLFRKSVSIDEQNQTLSELMRHNFSYLKNIDNPHLIANLIKRFFAKLKTPIFPYSSFHNLMHDQGIIDKLPLIKSQINSLPPKNYFPLMFLIEFLVDKVISVQKYTLMTSNNVAICFAPCLLRSQKPSELDLIYATKSSHVLKIILDNFQHIFGEKKQRQKKIRSAIQTQRHHWQKKLSFQIKSLSSQSKQDKEKDPFL